MATLKKMFMPPSPPPLPPPPALPPPTPAEAGRYKRLPVATDPDMLAAAQRTRAAALARKGRLSTILTDQNLGTVGAVGGGNNKLG